MADAMDRVVVSLDNRYERGCRVVNVWLQRGFWRLGFAGRVIAAGLYATLLWPIMLAGFFPDPRHTGADCNCAKCLAATPKDGDPSE